MKALSRRGKVRYGVILLLVFSVLLVFGSVWASSEGGHGESSFDKGKDLIWRTMNFVVLAGALIFLLRKPMAQALESRRQGIRDQLDDLEQQKQEAQTQLAEYKARLSRLDKEVEKIVADGGFERIRTVGKVTLLQRRAGACPEYEVPEIAEPDAVARTVA